MFSPLLEALPLQRASFFLWLFAQVYLLVCVVVCSFSIITSSRQHAQTNCPGVLLVTVDCLVPESLSEAELGWGGLLLSKVCISSCRNALHACCLTVFWLVLKTGVFSFWNRQHTLWRMAHSKYLYVFHCSSFPRELTSLVERSLEFWQTGQRGQGSQTENKLKKGEI